MSYHVADLMPSTFRSGLYILHPVMYHAPHLSGHLVREPEKIWQLWMHLFGINSAPLYNKMDQVFSVQSGVFRTYIDYPNTVALRCTVLWKRVHPADVVKNVFILFFSVEFYSK